MAVLTPSNSVLVSAQPPKQQVSLSTTLTAQSYSTLTHSPPATYMYYENWPTSCSSQHTPSTSPQAPPTTNSQRSCCVSVERPLVFEKEEEERRPSLARYWNTCTCTHCRKFFNLESLMSVWDVADFEGIQTTVCIHFTLFWL